MTEPLERLSPDARLTIGGVTHRRVMVDGHSIFLPAAAVDAIIAAERARLREAVEGLHDAICAFCNGNGLFDSAAVLALLEPQP